MSGLGLRRLVVAGAALAVVAALAAPAAPASASTCPAVDGAGTVTPAPAAGADWSGCPLAGASLVLADLRGASLAGADLTGANLHGAHLVGAVLDNAVLTGANASNADLSSASLSGTVLTGTVLTAATFSGTRSSGLVVGATAPSLSPSYSIRAGTLLGPRVAIVGADLGGLDLTGVSLASARLSGVKLAGADLSGGSLASADVTGADLTGTLLATTTLSGVAARGTVGAPLLPAGWSQTQGYLVGPGANLSGAQLQGADLHGRDLSGIDLTSTRLLGGSLAGATLSAARLSSSVLAGVDVTGVALGTAILDRPRGASLIGVPGTLPTGWRMVRGTLLGPGARVWGADLRHVSLAGIDLSGSDVRGGTWDGVDLSGANLDGASLEHLSLVDGILSSAQLVGTGLFDVDLTRGHLRHANVSSASLWNVDLLEADLGGAVGLSTATLTGASWYSTVCPDWYVNWKHQLGDCQRPRDVTPPKASLGPVAATQTTVSMRLAVHAADDVLGTGVQSLQWRVRSRTAGTTARWSSWTSYNEDPSATTVQVPGTPDSVTCVQVRAQDGAGTWSAWGSTRCATFLTAAMDLVWSPQWRSLGFYGWPITPRYDDNPAIVYAAGATLRTRQARTVRQLGVAARTCSTCGSIAVYVGRTRVARISLHSARTADRLFLLPRFSAGRSGVVRVVVTSAGRHMVMFESILVLSS